MLSSQELENSQSGIQRTQISDDIATQEDVPWASI